MRVGRLLAAAATLCLAGACGDAPDEEPRSELVVSAAASLTDAFGSVEAAFERQRTATDVTLNLAGSSTLAVQILEGAPVDVFAAADTAQMGRVAGAGLLAGEPRVFATNRLAVAVPRGNPAGVEGLDDFDREELLLGLCAREVPCGAMAREALRTAGIEPSIDTAEPDVRALLTKVAAGDAVEAVALPQEVNVTARYPIAVLRDAPRPEAARAFMEFVLSGEGRAILREHGFGVP